MNAHATDTIKQESVDTFKELAEKHLAVFEERNSEILKEQATQMRLRQDNSNNKKLLAAYSKRVRKLNEKIKVLRANDQGFQKHLFYTAQANSAQAAFERGEEADENILRTAQAILAYYPNSPEAKKARQLARQEDGKMMKVLGGYAVLALALVLVPVAFFLISEVFVVAILVALCLAVVGGLTAKSGAQMEREATQELERMTA